MFPTNHIAMLSTVGKCSLHQLHLPKGSLPVLQASLLRAASGAEDVLRRIFSSLTSKTKTC